MLKRPMKQLDPLIFGGYHVNKYIFRLYGTLSGWFLIWVCSAKLVSFIFPSDGLLQSIN